LRNRWGPKEWGGQEQSKETKFAKSVGSSSQKKKWGQEGKKESRGRSIWLLEIKGRGWEEPREGLWQAKKKPEGNQSRWGGEKKAKEKHANKKERKIL